MLVYFRPFEMYLHNYPNLNANGLNPDDLASMLKEAAVRPAKGGVNKIEMHFLTDIFVTCATCKGQRFNEQTLRIKFKGLTINDVLNLTINQAAEVFEKIPSIYNKLIVLQEVGLGYITPRTVRNNVKWW